MYSRVVKQTTWLYCWIVFAEPNGKYRTSSDGNHSRLYAGKWMAVAFDTLTFVPYTRKPPYASVVHDTTLFTTMCCMHQSFTTYLS